MPQGGLEALNDKDPLHIKAFQYDVACNGYELASGGIRNHRPEAMVKAFEIAGYGEETVVERFGGMYRAFHYGAPPHGGMAAGVDRIVMLLAGEQNLREVALFPMNQRAEDLLMGAPSSPTPKQLRELHYKAQRPRRLRERAALNLRPRVHDGPGNEGAGLVGIAVARGELDPLAARRRAPADHRGDGAMRDAAGLEDGVDARELGVGRAFGSAAADDCDARLGDHSSSLASPKTTASK